MLPRELASLLAANLRSAYRRPIATRSLTTRAAASEIWTGWSATGGVVPIPRRSFLRVTGPDTLRFIQGMVTNQVNSLTSEGMGQYAAFLSPQGRMLYDVFLYRMADSMQGSNDLLVECDASVVEELKAHLKRYLLRLKAKVSDVSGDFKPWHLWSPASLADMSPSASDGSSLLMIKDPRHATFGFRAVSSNDSGIVADVPQFDSSIYTLRRILAGIAEGPAEIPSGVAFPLESNLDRMNGVDFHKGCYVGQELTTRTHSRGMTRKRIMPVQILPSLEAQADPVTVDLSFAGQLPPPQSVISRLGADNEAPAAKDTATSAGAARERRQAEMGRFGSGIHNVGLALLRLEALESDSAPLQVEMPGGEKVYLKAFAPLGQ